MVKMIKDNYQVINVDTGEREGIIIDVSRKQIARIETDKDTGRSFIYVWNGIEEDYIEKIEIFIN